MTQVKFSSIKNKFALNKLGSEAATDQLRYLRRTPKPRTMTTAEWIRRIKYINSLIPVMDNTMVVLAEEELITEVIEPNFPQYLKKKY